MNLADAPPALNFPPIEDERGSDGGRASSLSAAPPASSIRSCRRRGSQQCAEGGRMPPASGATTRSRSGRGSSTLPSSAGPLGSAGVVPPVPEQRAGAVAPYAAWPERLAPKALHRRGIATPFLAIDTAALRQRVRDFGAAFEGRIDIRYAVKCIPLPGVLEAVVDGGGSFEIA